MKNIHVAIFMLFSLSLMAENNNYKITSMCYQIGDDKTSEWTPCDALLTINVEQNLIMIYTNMVQRYDVKSIRLKQDDDCRFIIFNALDSDDDPVVLTLAISDTGIRILVVCYDAYNVSYSIKELK